MTNSLNGTIDFQCSVKTVSEANQREHWAIKYKRKKEQQLGMLVALQNNLVGKKIGFPCVVKLTRIGPRNLDQDNLAGSFKHVQDSIARKLGCDDGDTTKVRWEYHQMPQAFDGAYGVKVSIVSERE